MAGVNPETISVQVAYARPPRVFVRDLQVKAGATIAEVIEQSGVLREFPDINLQVDQVGIFGSRRAVHDPVHAGDRVEIYRSLMAGPGEARRRRAQRQTRRQ